MHFGTMCTKQDHAVTGVLYDMRSVYEGLSQLSDMRKAREKLSRLEIVLMIIVMAKLRGNGKKIFRLGQVHNPPYQVNRKGHIRLPCLAFP